MNCGSDIPASAEAGQRSPSRGAIAPDPFGLLEQDRASRLLASLLNAGSFPPLLFAGPAGVGKRTAALNLARAANCAAPENSPCGRCSSCRTIALLRHPDVRIFFPFPADRRTRDDESEEDDAAEDLNQRVLERSEDYQLDKLNPGYDPKHSISIEAVRWIRREMAKPPMLARHRFFIILHAHRMKTEAANAFLKTLEEPQRQTALILATDRPQLLLDTIRSRCRLVRFSPLSRDAIRDRLIMARYVKPEEAELAAIVADGSLGKAINFTIAPDETLVQPVLDFFALPSAGTQDVLRTMSELDKTPLSTITFTLFFLFRQTILTKLGLDTAYARYNPAVKQKAARAGLKYLTRATNFLSGRLEDCRLNLNRKLFLYTLLSAVRPPRAK